MSGEDERASAGNVDPARQALLDEARTTVSEQRGQIDKIDDAAVRTVRITLVVLGILVSGPQLAPFPNLGLAGAIGTWALLGTLIAAATVYGTSRVFIGSAPDELAVDYTESPIVENTYIEILEEYDEGIVDNRRTLLANGFILSVARALLAVAVLGIVYGLVNAPPPERPTAPAAKALFASPLYCLL